MSTLSETPKLFTAAEVAELLRVSPRTVRRWRQQGLLPSVEVTGTSLFRFTATDVSDLLVRCRYLAA